MQFFHWKASEFQIAQVELEAGEVLHLSQSQQDKINALKLIFLKDHQLAETVFDSMTLNKADQHFSKWVIFSAALRGLRDYIGKLRKDLLTSLPSWRTHQSIFNIPCDIS